jgi:hypothetical protein
MALQEKIAAFRAFWEGRGPSLILIPAAKRAQYDTDNYVARFAHPERMWEAEAFRAREELDWPTDGIPTVRPNLGVVFIPGAAGQSYKVQEGQMPWPGEPLSREEIRSLPGRDIEDSAMMRLARRFYEVHRAAGAEGIAAYHPDTQGVFSLAHLFYGDRIFCHAVEDPNWVHQLLGITLTIHTRVVRALKSFLEEPDGEMTHGHSFPAGVYFPRAGVRISEDTATMISPRMVREFVLPYTERAVAPWGGCFVHYCGKHEFLFEQLCRMPQVLAIDLGNPEMYDTRWLLERCGQTGTVLFSPLKTEDGETWTRYLQRIAALAKAAGARLILRPTVFPDTREECAHMLDLWHELTT